MAVTSYGRNKNHDDEIKKTKRRPIVAQAIAVRLLIRVGFRPAIAHIRLADIKSKLHEPTVVVRSHLKVKLSWQIVGK